MKTRKTKTLRIEVFNEDKHDEFIKATLTIEYKYNIRFGYRVDTKVFQKEITFNEDKHLYYPLKLRYKEAIEFTKWICSNYGNLILSETKDYYED